MRSLPPDKVMVLAAAARRVVPDLARADADTTARFFRIVDDALMDRPASVRRQIGVFLGLIRRLPALRYGRTLELLSEDRQDKVLMWLQECPLSLLQKGFWGLRSLIFMGWYGQRQLWPEWGYEPQADGNERLHD